MSRKGILAAGLVLIVASEVWSETSLTVYNGNFAVVRENIQLRLKKGVTDVRFNDIAGFLEPSSVILRDPTEKWDIRILEQSYRGDIATRAGLLQRHEGKELEYIPPIRAGEVQRTMKARILRAGADPLVEIDGKLRFGLPGTPLFPKLTDDTILKPSIEWQIESNRGGALNAELAYVTTNMNWSSAYNVVAPEKGDVVNMIGWVTITNSSGKAFRKAKVKLMAGDVSKVPLRADLSGYAGTERRAAVSSPATVKEKTFDEYHLYSLPRKLTLHERETKQVEFVRAAGIKTRSRYIYDGVRYSQNYQHYGSHHLRTVQDYGTLSNPKVWVVREFKNTKKNQLGIPLPSGKMRFFRKDDDGQLELIGENLIDHTPNDEMLRMYTGNAFDLVGERKRTHFFTSSSESVTQEKFEIKVRNHKKEAVELTVVEHLSRWHNWEISQNSHDFKKVDAHTVEFMLKIPAGKEGVVTYGVHYTW